MIIKLILIEISRCNTQSSREALHRYGEKPCETTGPAMLSEDVEEEEGRFRAETEEDWSLKIKHI